MKQVFGLFGLMLLLSGCDILFKPSYDIELIPGNDIISFGEVWEDAGCIILGEEETEIPLQTTDVVDTMVIGETLVTYTTTYQEKEYTCKRVVKVIDRTPPTVQLLPGVDTIYVGEVFVDGGIETFDNVTTVVDVQVISTVDTSLVGMYTVTYIATDEAQNQTTITRMVHVVLP